MNLEKLLSVAERQIEKYDCITACVVTGLKCFDINAFTPSSLKAEVSKQFGWPHGSTFGNYKKIIEANQVEIRMDWPILNLTEGTRDTKNRKLLSAAKGLIAKDSVVLGMVRVDSNNAHCHILSKVTGDQVEHWDPATGKSHSSSLSAYLNNMHNGDMLAIGNK